MVIFNGVVLFELCLCMHTIIRFATHHCVARGREGKEVLRGLHVQRVLAPVLTPGEEPSDLLRGFNLFCIVRCFMRQSDMADPRSYSSSARMSRATCI